MRVVREGVEQRGAAVGQKAAAVVVVTQCWPGEHYQDYLSLYIPPVWPDLPPYSSYFFSPVSTWLCVEVEAVRRELRRGEVIDFSVSMMAGA